MKKILTLIFISIIYLDPSEGYTLITSLDVLNQDNVNSYATVLIDNDENIINIWEHETRVASIAYLMPDSTLYVPCKQVSGNGGPGQGPMGGRFKIMSWDGDIVWQYDLPEDICIPHHDIDVLPNGNILLICSETKTQEEALEAGIANINEPMILDMILEIEPIGVNEANIIWEWHFWDHLIQDQDPELSNYGVISENPQLLDINVLGSSTNQHIDDWNHTNCISYNSTLDQIIISSRTMNEIYVIDHSTTIIEAASHTGGDSGMGGDILYRWGNPENYDRGNASDRILGAQHGANWIPQGYPGEGNLILFNNFHVIGEGDRDARSAVLELRTPLNLNGTYDIDNTNPYAPESYLWMYQSDFFSNKQSGAFRLSNGNTLITSDQDRRLFEVDLNGAIVWEYQGDLNTARAIKYEIDYFSSVLPGDLNEDSIVNILDVILLVNIILNDDTSQSSADINNDGMINVTDIITLLNIILN